MAIGMPLEFEFFFLSSDGIVGIVKVFRLLLLLLYVFLSFFRKRSYVEGGGVNVMMMMTDSILNRFNNIIIIAVFIVN